MRNIRFDSKALAACGLVAFSAFCFWDAINGSNNAVRNAGREESHRIEVREKQRVAEVNASRIKQAKADAKAQVDARRAKLITQRELKSYEKAGGRWRTILIRHERSKGDLIRLARALHQEDAASNFRFIDSDEKFQQFMQWDINYPDPSYPYPEAWASKHYVAMINWTMGNDGIGWYLSDQYAQPIAKLE